MKSIRLIDVSKSYQGEPVLEHINLIIPQGKFFALLGPSGSGKTTILRLIAGFEYVDRGAIYLGDEDITFQPSNERKVNTVFQNYALFPHLNVFHNVAYGLVVKGIPRAEIIDRVMRVLKSVDLENHARKSIGHLSGGQQQRVALARAIVNEPEVLLLDEPLAALDIGLREKMLIELIELQDKLQTTFIYVTHDPSEALTVADQMAIMNYDGRIEQVSSPKQMYEFPNSSFVAQFVGGTNLFKGTLVTSEEGFLMRVPQLGEFAIDVRRMPQAHEGMQVILSIRPEKFLISPHEVSGFSNRLSAIVENIVYHGRYTQYNLRLANGQKVQAFEQNEEHFPSHTIDYDEQVWLYWQKENAVVLMR